MLIAMEFVDEGRVINDYGARYPGEYGGAYRDQGQLVALFTRKLEQHLVRLRRRLPFPENLSVERALRPYREIERENEELQRRLLLEHRHPGVTVVGISMREGQFVIMVGIHPYTDAAADDVRRAAEPHVIEVRPMGPVRQVPNLGSIPNS